MGYSLKQPESLNLLDLKFLKCVLKEKQTERVSFTKSAQLLLKKKYAKNKNKKGIWLNE